MPPSSVSAAGTRSRCTSAVREAAATIASDYRSPACRWGESPERRLRIADGAVERRARLGEQPAIAGALQVDHVVLDRDVLAVGEAMSDRGRHPGSSATKSLRLHLDHLGTQPRGAAVRGP